MSQSYSTWLTQESARLRVTPIVLGSATHDAVWESRQNWRCVASPPAGTREHALAALRMLVDDLVKYWSREMRERYPGRQARFYMWFDEQGGQICFGLVSAWHATLPFRAEVKLSTDPDAVLSKFLDSPYVSGIPLAEFESIALDDAFSEQDLEGAYVLQVYTVDIPV